MLRMALVWALASGPAAAQDQIEALQAEVAALTKKIDELAKAVGRTQDGVAETGKRIEGLYYGSCPNRRLCGFH